MPTPNPIGLRQWIWRAFVGSALIPLVLVETVLIAIYLLTNSAIRDAQIDHLRQTTLNDLQASVSPQSRLISEQLGQIASLTLLYRNLAAQALLEGGPAASPELELSPGGVRYSPQDNGGAAVFYSAATPAERHDLGKIARLHRLEPLMKEIKARNPLIASLYFNSWDSFNHIYPWFFTRDQYPADMDIPKYNFYYLANAEHNPARGVVWTDVYLDPAGHGWMMSAIAPVYRGDFLEGVVGIDITVSGILKQIGQLQVPWGGYAMLVSDDLSIMALPELGEEDFGLAELTEHSYLEAIRREVFKPEDFRLDRHPETSALAAAISTAGSGVQRVMLGGRPKLAAWATVEQSGWHLLAVVDEAAVFRQTNALASHYQQIGYLLIAGLLLFYIGFFALMWLRARQLSHALRNPIAGISQMMEEVGRGRWQPVPVQTDIRELDEMSRHTQDIGGRLAFSEAQRGDAQRRLELVLESATEGLWEYDIPSHSLRIRGNMVTRFGLPSGPFADSEFRQHIHPDDLPQAMAQIERIRLGLQQRYEAKYRFADARGEYRWLLSRGRVLEHDPETGAALVLAGTHVDIDALKRVEEELRAATLQAQAANEAKDRLLSGISHELRTPLNAILGFAQLMRMDCDDQNQAEAAEYLDEILLASRHLNQLLGEILEWSSLQKEAPPLDLQPVTVCSLMRECAEMIGLDLQQRGLQFELSLPDEDLQVLAEPRRLRQVLLNLLSNAMKYNVPEGRVALRAEAGPTLVRLLVEDTGLGIEPAQQAQVFEPFQRLGRESSMIQGTGIGLSLCLEFARLMNGQMGLHSEPGVGSRFWIELPRFVPNKAC